MKYGEVVTYIRNGVSLNALVLHSQQAVDGEHLILAYADPQFSGNGISRAIATAFDVKPFVQGANQGWTIPDAAAPDDSDLKGKLATDEFWIKQQDKKLAAADHLATEQDQKIAEL